MGTARYGTGPFLSTTYTVKMFKYYPLLTLIACKKLGIMHVASYMLVLLLFGDVRPRAAPRHLTQPPNFETGGRITKPMTKWG